jgi:zinc/manganese transport system permease protein
MDILELMAAPFVECLVLVAIHTYLGIHVLKRRVIFVDLALAQIAALGTTVGFLFGIMPETSGALLFSLVFAFLGAAVFSVTRFRSEKVPQEAIIGLTYAIACAVAVLVVEKTRGAEHLKDILTGNLLWVTWADVGVAAAVYAGIGAVHFVFRKRFMLISDDPEVAFRAGLNVRMWDFLFYMTFGAVITFSTRVAGVLLVFVFLVAPAILAFMLTDRLWLQLVIGWATGTVVTVSGLYLSWVLDLPSGPAVIAFYGLALLTGGVVILLLRSPRRGRTALGIATGALAVTLACIGMLGLGRLLGDSSLGMSREAERVAAGVADDHQTAEARQADTLDRRRIVLRSRVGACVGERKLARYIELVGPEEQMAFAREKLPHHPRRALESLLMALADDEQSLLYRQEALDLVRELTGEDFGYDPDMEARYNLASLNRLCDRIRAMKRASVPSDGATAE